MQVLLRSHNELIRSILASRPKICVICCFMVGGRLARDPFIYIYMYIGTQMYLRHVAVVGVSVAVAAAVVVAVAIASVAIAIDVAVAVAAVCGGVAVVGGGGVVADCL